MSRLKGALSQRRQKQDALDVFRPHPPLWKKSFCSPCRSGVSHETRLGAVGSERPLVWRKISSTKGNDIAAIVGTFKQNKLTDDIVKQAGGDGDRSKREHG
jgi:hypothetical protein